MLNSKALFFQYPNNNQVKKMPNLDLFNEPSITHDDINLWLDNVTPNLSNQRKDYYVTCYDIANKIKLSKLNLTFFNLIKNENDPPETYSAFKTKYKCDPPEPTPACNNMICHCKLKSCPFAKKIKRRARNRRYYAKKTKQLTKKV